MKRDKQRSGDSQCESNTSNGFGMSSILVPATLRKLNDTRPDTSWQSTYQPVSILLTGVIMLLPVRAKCKTSNTHNSRRRIAPPGQAPTCYTLHLAVCSCVMLWAVSRSSNKSLATSMMLPVALSQVTLEAAIIFRGIGEFGRIVSNSLNRYGFPPPSSLSPSPSFVLSASIVFSRIDGSSVVRKDMFHFATRAKLYKFPSSYVVSLLPKIAGQTGIPLGKCRLQQSRRGS
jgi:hypothetical protein